MLGTFLQSRSGNFASIFALTLPFLLGLTGGGVDLYVHIHHRSELQATADAAVLAAASEAGMKGWSKESATEVATSVIASNLSNRFSGATFAHEIEVSEKDRRIEVTLTQDHYGYFFVGYFTGSPQITVSSGAQATGQATVCIIVQEPKDGEAFLMKGNSRVSASGCSAYSNSVSTMGIVAKDLSRLKAQLTCSGGGYMGTLANYSPAPLTDCPILQDPLAARASLVDQALSGQACAHTKLKLEGVKKSLKPGTYCGGLQITDGSEVTFEPGIYVIKDGTLKAHGASTFKGEGVAFVFFGEKATLDLKNDTTVALSAPTEGLMAGILAYARPAAKSRDFKIQSQDAQKLVGTVYLPADSLVVGGDEDGDGVCDVGVGELPIVGQTLCESDLGAASSWTAIVADKLEVTSGATLVLNSDYENSDVPVPQGLGPNSAKVSLAR
ncbi:MAG TPA: pilus assembly protein TadG-related protein [Mesorhizobium sp.]|jgi:Flp pilus assembly protein TadG|nr:pilus assembly protein TadG-related protein [Mesorhizobium sp.]